MFDPGLGAGDLGEGSPDLRAGGAGGGGELHEGPAGAELVGEVRAGQSRFLGRGSDVKSVVWRWSKAGRVAVGDPPRRAGGREQDEDEGGAECEPGCGVGGKRGQPTCHRNCLHCRGPPKMSNGAEHPTLAQVDRPRPGRHPGHPIAEGGLPASKPGLRADAHDRGLSIQ